MALGIDLRTNESISTDGSRYGHADHDTNVQDSRIYHAEYGGKESQEGAESVRWQWRNMYVRWNPSDDGVERDVLKMTMTVSCSFRERGLCGLYAARPNAVNGDVDVAGMKAGDDSPSSTFGLTSVRFVRRSDGAERSEMTGR